MALLPGCLGLPVGVARASFFGAVKICHVYPRRTVSAVLPMALEAAPAPRNKAILLKELPAHRAVGRYLFGHVTPDDVLARHKTELLPLINDVRQTESEAESESESDPEAESEPESEAEPESEPESEAESEAAALIRG